MNRRTKTGNSQDMQQETGSFRIQKGHSPKVVQNAQGVGMVKNMNPSSASASQKYSINGLSGNGKMNP